MQKVSPAHAPSALITVGSIPSRKSRAEQVPASGAQGEVRNAARALLEAVIVKREGRMIAGGERLKQPRQK